MTSANKIFKPNQRWISETEPELGLGIVLSADNRMLEIGFPGADETRRYALANAPLRRVIFLAQDTICTVDGKTHVVDSANTQADGCVSYSCNGIDVAEKNLSEHLGGLGPRHRLMFGVSDSPDDYTVRQMLLEMISHIRQSPVRGFCGGKIALLPHQLHIAATVAQRRMPRALLADETGLGKTIEACLILHRLILTGRVQRALIVVPSPLVHQWFIELFRRFNLTFRIFDKEYCSDHLHSNPFLEEPLGICSLQLLCDIPALGSMATQSGWDMVIIDEAHHIRHGQPAFNLLESFARLGNGLLLITATPEQLGRRDHFERLKLLDPHRYTTFDAYEEESSYLHTLSESIDQHITANAIDIHTTNADAIMIPANTALHPRQNNSNSISPAQTHGDPPENITLSQCIDRYGVGRSVFRNTRLIVAGFPKRHVHITPLTGDVSLQPGSRTDPRCSHIASLIKSLKKQKLLIICAARETAIAIQQTIQSLIRVDIVLFLEDMTLIQQDRNAAWFADPAGAQVMVCSEIGSEGRNFQFCSHLLLFDLPADPELLEQRIGRLDRIGQGKRIDIHVPYISATAHEVLARWYHEGLDAFAHHVPAAGRVHDAMHESLEQMCSSLPDHDGTFDTRMKALLEHTQALCDRLTRRLIRGRDRLLEIASYQPVQAGAMIAQIEDHNLQTQVDSIMNRLFRHFGIITEDAGTHKTAINSEYLTDSSFPLPRGERPVITFNRAVALTREDVELVTIDHPMFTGAMELFLSSHAGTTACIAFTTSKKSRLFLEAVFIVECVAPKKLETDRFLPPTPLLVCVDHTGADCRDEVTALCAISEPHSMPLSRFLSSLKIRDVFLPAMLDSVEKKAQSASRPVIEKAVDSAVNVCTQEIDRLRALAHHNDSPDTGEISLYTALQKDVCSALNASRLRLDSLRLIYAGARVEEKKDEGDD